MSFLLFVSAVILLMAGHTVKSGRQKLFADFYEDVKPAVFNEGLAAGYLVNLVVPFRLGDLLRAVIVGRRMRNGFSFAFATVVVDRILDVIVVGFIYLALYLISPSVGFDTGRSAFFYMLLSLVALILIAAVTFARRGVKKVIRFFTGIFNEKIELTLMFFFWSIITAFRDMAVKMAKRRLALYTLVMWGLYIASYYVISLVLRGMGGDASLMYVFSYLFSSSSIDRGTLTGGYIDTVMVAYLAISAGVMLAISIVFDLTGRKRQGTAAYGSSTTDTCENSGDEVPEKTMMLLPQVHETDRRAFLENYFEADRTAYVRGYLEANNDIQIISDYSAGSNATTLLAIRDGRTIFRKYVVGEDADKLHDQVEWIRRYRDRLPLPGILDEKRGEGMTLYDMPAVTGSTGFFEYIHTNPAEQSFGILKKVCEALEEGLYSGTCEASLKGGRGEGGTPDAEEVQDDGAAGESGDREAAIERYIQEKVQKNISLIEGEHRLSELLSYDEVVINGRKVPGFARLKEAMKPEKLREVFASDELSPIHGDVTVENIITVPVSEEYPDGYYLIDPNPGNILDSRYIDLAKILQSLHGGYEFLMRTDRCRVSGNEIQFMSGMSRAYRDLYREYRAYLESRYDEKAMRSIRYHEMVNWLRLMPYKLEKNPQTAAVFLAGLLLTADDII